MSDDSQDKEGNFYKGLFFGALIGAGLTLFLSTDAGRDVARNLKRKINEALDKEMIADDYEFEEVNTETYNSDVPKKSSPRRFFRNKKTK